MQSSVNTTFSGNTCVGGHGISIGSLGGDVVDASDTVAGLTVVNNIITNSMNGIRIKTIVGLQGLVTGQRWLHGLADEPSRDHPYHDGLTGTATDLYDVLTNHKVVSNWHWSRIGVTAKTKGSCVGQPSTVSCA